MDISIIIPTYNRSQLLQKTLTSLVNQVCKHIQFEVIVVDDGSTDNTKEITQQFKNELELHYLFQEDLGFRAAAARNLGIFNAISPICVFLDTGMLVSPTFVESHYNAHNNNLVPLAVIGYAYGLGLAEEKNEFLINMLDESNIDTSIKNIEPYDCFKDIREEKFYSLYGENLNMQPAPWILFWTCNVSVKTTILMSIGGFDESFSSWGLEDIELAYRLFSSDVEFVLQRNAVAIHYPHKRDNSANHQSDYQNKLYFHKKYGNEDSNLLLMTRYNLRVNGIKLHLQKKMDCSSIFSDEPEVLSFLKRHE